MYVQRKLLGQNRHQTDLNLNYSWSANMFRLSIDVCTFKAILTCRSCSYKYHIFSLKFRSLGSESSGKYISFVHNYFTIGGYFWQVFYQRATCRNRHRASSCIYGLDKHFSSPFWSDFVNIFRWIREKRQVYRMMEEFHRLISTSGPYCKNASISFKESKTGPLRKS